MTTTDPTSDIGRALGTDYFLLRDELTADELGADSAPWRASSGSERSR